MSGDTRETAGTPPVAMDTASHRVKLPSLTGLRFVAAFMVFLFHTSLSFSNVAPFKPTNPFANQDVSTAYETVAGRFGYVGVSFFFVLSGFVLAWSTPIGDRARDFWRRRMLKIFPNHIVTWAICLALFAAATATVGQITLSLFLLQSFTPDATVWSSVNGPSWSLSSELMFYLLFPLLILPVRKIAGNRLWAWAGAMVGGMLVIVLINQFLVAGPVPVPGQPPAVASPTQFWLGYFFPPPRMFEFILGMLLARIVLEQRWPKRIGMLPAGALVAVSYVIGLFLPHTWSFTFVTVVPLALLICAAATADIDNTPSVFRRPWAVWLGEVSFAFYMCQGFVVLYGRNVVFDGKHSTPAGIAILLGFLAVNLLAGWALYRLVERPIMRRWSRPTRRRVSEPPAAEVPA